MAPTAWMADSLGCADGWRGPLQPNTFDVDGWPSDPITLPPGSLNVQELPLTVPE